MPKERSDSTTEIGDGDKRQNSKFDERRVGLGEVSGRHDRNGAQRKEQDKSAGHEH